MIVDDEPLSRDVLRKYIGQVPDLDLVAECADGLEATHRLREQQCDLLFLDIQMPGLTGLSLARSLKRPPLIIFTTAYPRFAVEGFELDALDYLVKPYSFERFLKAAERALERLKENREDGNRENSNREDGNRKIVVKSDKKLYAIDPREILYVEGQGDYIRLHLEKMRLMVHDTLKNFAASLPPPLFLRVHKSYLVNTERIRYMEGNRLRIGESDIPVSPAFREELMKRLSGG
jgi:DNA-binding LytR/AlgR family response regulator